MWLFKRQAKKSSCEAPRVTYEALSDKIASAQGELRLVDDKLEELVDRQNELYSQLADLQNLMDDLGPEETSCLVFIEPSTSIN
jgi:hypothetical protein